MHGCAYRVSAVEGPVGAGYSSEGKGYGGGILHVCMHVEAYVDLSQMLSQRLISISIIEKYSLTDFVIFRLDFLYIIDGRDQDDRPVHGYRLCTFNEAKAYVCPGQHAFAKIFAWTNMPTW